MFTIRRGKFTVNSDKESRLSLHAPAASRSRIAPYRSLTRLSLDVNRGALPPVAEMPIGAGTVSRWVREAATLSLGFDLAPSGGLGEIIYFPQ